MLEMLKMKADEHFEGFCEALIATAQRDVVTIYLQQHRVCFTVEYSTPVWNITVTFLY